MGWDKGCGEVKAVGRHNMFHFEAISPLYRRVQVAITVGRFPVYYSRSTYSVVGTILNALLVLFHLVITPALRSDYYQQHHSETNRGSVACPRTHCKWQSQDSKAGRLAMEHKLLTTMS